MMEELLLLIYFTFKRDPNHWLCGYLHIQPCRDGYDFTLYDADSLKEIDGGYITPQLLELENNAPVTDIRKEIFDILEMDLCVITKIPLVILDNIIQ